MSSRLRPLPAGFVPPCLPSGSKTPPSGKEWLHEIKHDGFRVIARKVGTRVKLYSRPGNDLTYRFPLIVEAMAGCAHTPASSTAKPSCAVTMELHPSIASGTGSMTTPCSFMPST